MKRCADMQMMLVRRWPARRPPSRPRGASRSRARDRLSRAGSAGIGCAADGGGAEHPYAAIAVVEEARAIQTDGSEHREDAPAWQRPYRGMASSRAGSACPVAATHRSAAADSWWTRRSRPRWRLACAPWIATLPNTAIAPVAAIASDRARVLRRAQFDRRRYASTPDPKRRLQAIEDGDDHIEQERQQQQQRKHQDHAAEDRRLRRGEQDDRRRREARQSADQSRRSSSQRRMCCRRSDDSGAADARRSPGAGSARRRRRPSSPAPAAIAMLCQVTIRCEPTGNANDR